MGKIIREGLLTYQHGTQKIRYVDHAQEGKYGSGRYVGLGCCRFRSRFGLLIVGDGERGKEPNRVGMGIGTVMGMDKQAVVEASKSTVSGMGMEVAMRV